MPITGLGAHQIAARGLVRSFQVARVFGNLTVRENLMVPYFACAHAPANADGEAQAAPPSCCGSRRSAPLADDPGETLSGGQRMLLQACAGFMIPDVQLLRARRAVRRHQSGGQGHADRADRAREPRRSGAAFLIVSHEMEIIRRICPRVTVMIAGSVAAEGTLDEIARREDVITAYLGRAFAMSALLTVDRRACRLPARRRHPARPVALEARARTRSRW